MGLTEHISQNLNVPFVIITEGDSKKYLCSNGVLFTKEEYLGGIDLIAEYEKKKKEEQRRKKKLLKFWKNTKIYVLSEKKKEMIEFMELAQNYGTVLTITDELGTTKLSDGTPIALSRS